MAKSLAQAAIASVATRGSSEVPLSTAVALAKAFLVKSAKTKGKKLLLFTLAMGVLTAGGLYSVHALAPDSLPPPTIQAESEPPQIVADRDAEAMVKLKTLIPRIVHELEHMMFLSKAECLSAEVKKGEAKIAASWQIFLVFGVKTKSLIRLTYDIDRHEMGVYLDFVGDGGHYRPVDPEMGAYTNGMDFSHNY